MNREQINRLYAQTPVLRWPWMPQPFSYKGSVTFASLCETPCSAWVQFGVTSGATDAANDNEGAQLPRTLEYAEALRAVS